MGAHPPFEISTVDDDDDDDNNNNPSPPPSISAVQYPPPSDQHPKQKNNNKIFKKRRKPTNEASSSSSSSTSTSTSSSSSHSILSPPPQKVTGPTTGSINIYKRRNSRLFSLVNRKKKKNNNKSESDIEAVAFHLGISFAAVIAEVLKRKDLTNEHVPVDLLSEICTAAVRESLSNVFGDKFSAFARNFEESFGSTLCALGVARNFSKFYDRDPKKIASVSSRKEECTSRSCDLSHIEPAKQAYDPECVKEAEEVEDDKPVVSRNFELLLQEDMSQQLACSASDMQSYVGNRATLSTIEKSVVEQSRANDLKRVEIGLIRKKLQLKETQLALNSESNLLRRCNLSLGVSTTSFKVEKFKNKVEEARQSELLRTCADFLVAGLLLMLGCLGYGVYAFSYEKIHQLTNSCSPATESKSWWIPRPMSSFNSGLQNLSCQFVVYSRMLFGILMIGAIVYVLIQRSASSTAMPITFLVLLLGVCCGFAGRFCVYTLGGDGNMWLIYFEALCALHFCANFCTPTLYYILNGEVLSSQSANSRSLFPYLVRRWLFYLILLLVPICCGLLPFASPNKWWEEHFSQLIKNHLLATYDESYDDTEIGLHQ